MPAHDERKLFLRTLYLLTHPDVLISPDVPVPQWPLNERGRKRMRAALYQFWMSEITAIYSSAERKAIDGAEILAEALGLPVTQIEELGENDRSATGFLPPDEFQRVADEFFARPEESVRGWERAIDAQTRIVNAVEALAAADPTDGAIAIVSHGAVGTLLYCHLAGEKIDRRWDQPPNNGGNYFSFTLSPHAVHSWWKPIDNMDEELAEVREQGAECARRGGQYTECHFLQPGKVHDVGWLYWLRGFQSASTPDPECSRCGGSGMLTWHSNSSEPSPYDGNQFRCLCNKP